MRLDLQVAAASTELEHARTESPSTLRVHGCTVIDLEVDGCNDAIGAELRPEHRRHLFDEHRSLRGQHRHRRFAVAQTGNDRHGRGRARQRRDLIVLQQDVARTAGLSGELSCAAQGGSEERAQDGRHAEISCREQGGRDHIQVGDGVEAAIPAQSRWWVELLRIHANYRPAAFVWPSDGQSTCFCISAFSRSSPNISSSWSAASVMPSMQRNSKCGVGLPKGLPAHPRAARDGSDSDRSLKLPPPLAPAARCRGEMPLPAALETHRRRPSCRGRPFGVAWIQRDHRRAIGDPSARQAGLWRRPTATPRSKLLACELLDLREPRLRCRVPWLQQRRLAQVLDGEPVIAGLHVSLAEACPSSSGLGEGAHVELEEPQ